MHWEQLSNENVISEKVEVICIRYSDGKDVTCCGGWLSMVVLEFMDGQWDEKSEKMILWSI